MADCAADIDNSVAFRSHFCHRSYDFTLLFEEIFFKLVPGALFFAFTLFRIFHVRRKKAPRSRGRRNIGLVMSFMSSCLVVSALSICISILWSFGKTRTAISSITPIVDTLIFPSQFYLFYLESKYPSPPGRPSRITGAYLFISFLLDLIRFRTLWFLPIGKTLIALELLLLYAKLVVIIVQSNLVEQQTDRGVVPTAYATFYNLRLFCWYLPLVEKGYRRVLGHDNLLDLDHDLKSKTVDNLFREAWERKKLSDRPLVRSLLLAFWPHYIWPIIPRLAWMSFSLCQPLLTNQTLAYLTNRQQGLQDSDGLGRLLVVAYGAVYIGIAVCQAWYWNCIDRYIVITRSALIAAIHGHILEPVTSVGDQNVSLTLIGGDIPKITQGLESIHEIWANALQTVLAIYLLYQQLGSVSLISLSISVVCAIASWKVAVAARKRQDACMQAMEERLANTIKMLRSFKSLRMLGLGNLAADDIQEARLREVDLIKHYRITTVFAVGIAHIPELLTPVLTFIIYSLFSDSSSNLLVTKLFTSLSLFQLIAAPLLYLFQLAPFIAFTVTCLNRIEEFLNDQVETLLHAPEQLPRRLSRNFKDGLESETIRLIDNQESEGTELDTLPELKTAPNPDLRDMNAISIQDGQFGWSSADNPILRNINLECLHGQFVVVIGGIGCGKSTLLRGLMGETPVSHGETEIDGSSIAFCEQVPWLPNQSIHDTVIGFEPFDAQWYKNILEISCCGDILASVGGDDVLIGSGGSRLSGGQCKRVALARALYARKKLLLLDDVFSGLDDQTRSAIFPRLLQLSKQHQITTVLVTNNVEHLSTADLIVALDEKGEIAESGTYAFLMEKKGYTWTFATNLQHLEALRSEKSLHAGENGPIPINSSVEVTCPPTVDSNNRWSLYRYYCQAIGWRHMTIFLLFVVSFTAFFKIPDAWVKWWTDWNAAHPGQQSAFYMAVYAALDITALAAFIALTWHLSQNFVPSGARFLHARVLNVIRRAPISFLVATDSGDILNRFSQDLGIIDGDLVRYFMNATTESLNVLAQVVLLSQSNIYILLGLPIAVAVLCLVQVFYLRTSRSLQTISLEAWAPLQSQFIDTVSGRTSIRAFNTERQWHERMYRFLDASSRPMYLLLCGKRWMGLIMDLVVAFLALIVVDFAVGTNDVNVGSIGVGLLQIMYLGEALRSFVLGWTDLDTSMSVVARVKRFDENSPQQLLLGRKEPELPINWPQKGEVELSDVQISHEGKKIPVFAKISLSIKAGEKIGICGLSGSGKSTLLLALLRIIDIDHGTINIDGIDISSFSHETISRALSVVPQEFASIIGSVRRNLDPHKTKTDEEIFAILRTVYLHNLASTNILDQDLGEISLSHGQKQLFGLGRALVCRSSLVLIDEIGSSTDSTTRAKIREIIAQGFSGCTVLQVAHDLDDVVNADRVLVLSGDGYVAAFDTPDRVASESQAFQHLFSAA